MTEMERLRALSRRWRQAVETTNDPELQRHFADHAEFLATLAERLDRRELSSLDEEAHG